MHGDPDAGVGHRDFRPLSPNRRGDRDLSDLGELDGVGDQVLQDVPQLVGVAVDVRQIVGKFSVKSDALLASQRTDDADDFTYHFAKRDGGDVQFLPARLDA